MNTYFAFWRRGWWAWLYSLCANLAVVVMCIPFVAMGGKPSGSDLSLAIVIWLVVGAPAWGWLFEYFAAKSERLLSDD
jgi:hypothetical protein